MPYSLSALLSLTLTRHRSPHWSLVSIPLVDLVDHAFICLFTDFSDSFTLLQIYSDSRHDANVVTLLLLKVTEIQQNLKAHYSIL